MSLQKAGGEDSWLLRNSVASTGMTLAISVLARVLRIILGQRLLTMRMTLRA